MIAKVVRGSWDAASWSRLAACFNTPCPHTCFQTPTNCLQPTIRLQIDSPACLAGLGPTLGAPGPVVLGARLAVVESAVACHLPATRPLPSWACKHVSMCIQVNDGSQLAVLDCQPFTHNCRQARKQAGGQAGGQARPQANRQAAGSYMHCSRSVSSRFFWRSAGQHLRRSCKYKISSQLQERAGVLRQGRWHIQCSCCRQHPGTAF